ncbi:hypothetical protein ACP4OV_026805 [Aristida adscensionis]
MDHLDEHGSDDSQAWVASDGELRFTNKKSKVWDEYKPFLFNGEIQRAECRHCHTYLSCRTNTLLQHQKICRAKQGLGLSQQQQNVELRYVLVNEIAPLEHISPDSHGEINFVSHSESSVIRLEAWKGFTPVFVDGKIYAADCVRCHTRVIADKARRKMRQHTLACEAQHRRGVLSESESSVPSLKSRPQVEFSTALKNGNVQIAEPASKFLKGSSGDRSPVDQHILVSPTLDLMGPAEQNTSSNQTAPDISRKFDQEASYQELTRMIILRGYPLSIVDHEEMRRFTKSLNSAFNMASSMDIEEYSTLLFQKEKAELKEKIALSSHRVSLSASIWAPQESVASVRYICLAVHFVDSDWKLQRRIIKFAVLRSSPSNLDRMIHFKISSELDSESGPFSVIWEAISDWNLDQKLFSLTSVSEIRNAQLKPFLIRRKCLPIGGELYNIACLDDVLNGIVSKGQPMLHLVGDILERSIKALMSSSLTQKQLLDVVTKVELKCPKEDSNQWHKIYFGLEVLLHFRKAFPSEESLSDEDTKTLESVYKILRAFHRAIEVISGPFPPTANMYFNEVWKVRTTLQEEASADHTLLASIVQEMHEAFNDFWKDSYVWLSVAVVLDPRFKYSLIEFRLKRAFGSDAVKYISTIRDTISEMFLEYCSPVDKASVDTSNHEACDTGVDGLDSDSLEDWVEHLNVLKKCEILTELETYLADALVPRKDDFDILNWWMNNSEKYPTLSVMARDVLPVPAYALRCEEALSSKGPVIHKQWSTLNVKTIEALVCARDWIK